MNIFKRVDRNMKLNYKNIYELRLLFSGIKINHGVSQCLAQRIHRAEERSIRPGQ